MSNGKEFEVTDVGVPSILSPVQELRAGDVVIFRQVLRVSGIPV